MTKRDGISRRKQALRLIESFVKLRWVREIWMYLLRIDERMEANHIFLSAAGLSFNALLCFIPLLLIVFYVLGFYLDSADALATVDTWIQQLELFPYQKDQIRGIVIELIEEVVSGSALAGVLGGVGLLWTSSTLFAALRSALNNVFGIHDTKNFLLSKLKDIAMLSIVGIVLISVTVVLYSISFIKGIGQQVFGMELDFWIFNDALNMISPFVLGFVLFLLVFYLVPDKRLSKRVIIMSSGIAAILWGIAKIVFGYYLNNLWRIGIIYGPYAIIAASALWVYYSSLTVLFAAEVAEMNAERLSLKNLFSLGALRTTVRRGRNADNDYPRVSPTGKTEPRFREKR
ncbi:MAG: YihY/virulence factor BrkB family protein [Bacteroidetes bacterium]|nr:YihY/virulence factor BrkB family protein [Bacteroidota bacterium]